MLWIRNVFPDANFQIVSDLVFRILKEMCESVSASKAFHNFKLLGVLLKIMIFLF